MKISYNWLQSYFDKKLPKPKDLMDILIAHSFEVEKLSAISYQSSEKKKKAESRKLKADDYILDIDVLPNRAHDCLSHFGMAKEVATLLDFKIRNPKSEIRNNIKIQNSKFKIEEPELCKRYIGRRIEDIKIKKSPKQISEFLEAIGQKSINNIVDATNYVMFELGQPLHAFDADKVDGKIIVRYAKKGEKITTLDGQEGPLNENILVIADEKGVLAIAGIKGGKKAEIDENTKNIILESANFEQANIRKTSKKICLRTESSLRFENDISTEMAGEAMDRVTSLVLEVAGGKAGGIVDIYPKKQPVYTIGIYPKDISKLIGMEIKEKDIIDIFKRLNFGVKKINKDNLLRVTIPAERLDIRIKEDLVEEVARVYGFEKIPSILPEEVLIAPKVNENVLYADLVKNILLGIGFSEVYSCAFDSTGDIELENPIAKDKKFLRKNLLNGLKRIIDDNLKYFKKVRIFEIGRVFNSECENISFAVIASDTDFYEMKGVVETILEKIGITNFYFDDHPDRVAEIRVGNSEIGVIDHNAFEINFEMLVMLATEEAEYRPISKFPASKRDLAIFVPLKTKVIEVMDVIENTAGELLIDTDLFDIYENPEKGRKSFAFHLEFQSHEKTLSDKEISDLMNKIMDALDFNVEWEVRKN